MKVQFATILPRCACELFVLPPSISSRPWWSLDNIVPTPGNLSVERMKIRSRITYYRHALAQISSMIEFLTSLTISDVGGSTRL